jgi:hypothetical protein
MHKFNIQPGEIVLVTSAKVVQHPDGGLPLKVLRQMTPDKPGTTCNQDSHDLELVCGEYKIIWAITVWLPSDTEFCFAP